MPREEDAPRAGGAATGPGVQADEKVTIPEPFNTLLERAMCDDRSFFEAQPTAHQYVRSPHGGEFWPYPDPPAGSLVVVTALEPGVRMRRVLLEPRVEFLDGGAA